jgi:hypothetical protein
MTPDIRRELDQLGTRTAGLGRPLKFQVLPGLAEPVRSNTLPAAKGSAKSRAAEDPLVQHFQNVFGAEIRTVIDHRKN